MKLINECKTSIRWRYTLIFIGLIGFILLAIVSADTFLLEPYYTREKVEVLEKSYTTLDNMLKAAQDSGLGISDLFPDDYDASDPSTETVATKYVKDLSESNNVSVVIIDTASDKIFASAGDSDFQKRKLSEYIFGNRKNFQEKILKTFDNYSIEQNTDRSNKNGYLESWGYFSDNKTSFIMSMPLSSIEESVKFFNRFLIAIGLIAIVIGSVIIYIASYKITKPIDSLAKLSEKMARLDFSARYEGCSQDEIGILGNSMNNLSERLEKSIGDLKTANNELQSDIENKRLIDIRRQEFVANVSHELKTPIALIQGYAEGLQDGMAEDPDSRNYYCGVIVDEAQKMNRMVRQLMNLSSLEQGKDLPEFKLFDLSVLVQGVITASDILIRQKDAHVEVDVPEGTMVWADEFKMEEVITNYLNNALNHLEDPDNISIYSEREADGNVSIHVSNTGKQIPEEDLDKIWEKFFKVDKAHTRSYGGSGLGLSIVKAIADAHHQKCGVRNTRTGVDFWFRLEGKDARKQES